MFGNSNDVDGSDERLFELSEYERAQVEREFGVEFETEEPDVSPEGPEVDVEFARKCCDTHGGSLEYDPFGEDGAVFEASQVGDAL